MKRSICIICAALLLLLCACGSSDKTETTGAGTTQSEAETTAESKAAETTPAETSEEASAEAGISMYDLRKAMLAADPALPEMMAVSNSDDKADELFAYLSDLDYSKVDGYFLAYAADGMAYEIAVVALKDEGDVSELKDSLIRHVEGRVNLYKSYAPDQVEKAEDAEIVTNGRYVALIMCDDKEAVKAAFEEGIK